VASASGGWGPTLRRRVTCGASSRPSTNRTRAARCQVLLTGQ
jgi:hypothetical protein